MLLNRIKKNKKLFIFIILLVFISYTFYSILILTLGDHSNNEYNDFSKSTFKNKENKIIQIDNSDYNDKKKEDVDITNDKENDDVKIILNNNDNSKINKILRYSTTLCEENSSLPLEALKGYHIYCPVNYEIKIENAFYGRQEKDYSTCINNKLINLDFYKSFFNSKKCGKDVKNKLEKACNGKRQCNIKVSNILYGNPCEIKLKYMEIKYQCIPLLEKKEPKFAIVMYSDNLKQGSVYEKAVNDFKKYSERYNYEFFFNNKTYNVDREVYYMKLYSLIEFIIKGLNEETYDWILWTDTDVVLTNPNIELSAFIPPEDQDNIHFIITSDHNGFNAGVFLIRVHPWSLTLMMRANTYNYFSDGKKLRFADQSAIRNVLMEGHEEEHYIVVPQTWFNSYNCEDKKNIRCVIRGDILVHFPGKKETKVNRMEEFIKKIEGNSEWTSRTTSEMRKMALEYYNLPKDQQRHIL